MSYPLFQVSGFKLELQQLGFKLELQQLET